MKILKQLYNISLCILICISFLFPVIEVNAKTIRDYQKELNNLEKQYNNNKNQQNQLNQNIKNSETTINQSKKEIQQAQDDLVATGKKIQDLNANISEKRKQIDEMMVLLQQEDGDIAYLEYIFGSANMTDFIHRSTIVEEITEYNNKMIQEMNNMVEESKKLEKELEQKQITLQQKISSLNNSISKYKITLSDLSDIQIDTDSEIRALRSQIEYYKKLCNNQLDKDVSKCNTNTLPYDTALWRPTTAGYISSPFGGRWGSYHYAVDIALNGYSNVQFPVYSAASGQVVLIERSSCGGNYVIVQHNIKGTYYTTLYMHLYTVNVTKNQTVTKDTQIGLMGGNTRYPGLPGYTPWDSPSCSTGRHLHFMTSRGKNFTYSQVENNVFNPETLVNFPSSGSWKDRITKY